MALDDSPSPHPITPPQDEEELHQWLRLLRSRRVGPTTFFRLMAEHGGATAALEALPGVAAKAGVKDYQVCPSDRVDMELRAARMAGAHAVAYGTKDYPESLLPLNDAPPVLWIIGRTDILLKPAVALVGARNASSLGTRMARKLGEDLGSAGIAVVSGLARGIDAAAHAAALKTGTIAVMGGGADVIYPAENAVLGQEIIENGCRLSEQPMGLQPMSRHFPIRNRIIAGLARMVVVIEAAGRSGSLITARAALDQGRDVGAVPGHPFDGRAGGCNILLRDGAIPVRNAKDVLEALSARNPDRTNQARPEKSSATVTHDDQLALHRDILNRLGSAPLAEDQLIRDLAKPAALIGAEIMALELDGKVQRQPGGLICKL